MYLDALPHPLPVGVNAPYRVAPDTYVIPELVPGRPAPTSRSTRWSSPAPSR